MRLDDEDYEFIKQEVIDVFIRYDVKCTPISGFEIAQKMGIIVISYSGLSRKARREAKKISPDGFYLEPGDGREYIYYDDTRGYERSNMTILHEIGHCVLGHNNDTDPEIAEAEANFFAKYAIAPPPLVHRITPSSPEDILGHFSISYEAACNALNYYYKWLRFGCKDYTAYELKLLHQIPAAS